jgi:hypothetical protein
LEVVEPLILAIVFRCQNECVQKDKNDNQPVELKYKTKSLSISDHPMAYRLALHHPSTSSPATSIPLLEESPIDNETLGSGFFYGFFALLVHPVHRPLVILINFVFIHRVDVFSLDNPVQIALEVLFELLFFTKFLK